MRTYIQRRHSAPLSKHNSSHELQAHQPTRIHTLLRTVLLLCRLLVRFSTELISMATTHFLARKMHLLIRYGGTRTAELGTGSIRRCRDCILFCRYKSSWLTPPDRGHFLPFWLLHLVSVMVSCFQTSLMASEEGNQGCMNEWMDKRTNE